MGADRAILIIATDDVNCDIEPLDVAKILHAIVVEEKIDLVLCGKQAIDNDMNATGQMLSALMGTSQATYASKIELNTNKATVTREVDGGLQVIEVSLPAVISVDLRQNETRYASLPNIMKAKRKPLEQKTPEDFKVKKSVIEEMYRISKCLVMYESSGYWNQCFEKTSRQFTKELSGDWKYRN